MNLSRDCRWIIKHKMSLYLQEKMPNTVWIGPVLKGVTCDILDWQNPGKEVANGVPRERKRRMCEKIFLLYFSLRTVFLRAAMGGVQGARPLKFSTFKANYVWGERTMDTPLAWQQMKRIDIYPYFSLLVCGCVHRPPPALPIPLLIIVMSEKRSSGRGCWAWFDWAVARVHTRKMKEVLL